MPKLTPGVRNSWIDHLPEDLCLLLRNAMQTLSLEPGEHLFRQGDVPAGIYEVKAGRLKVYSYNEEGKETFFDVCSSGEILGDTSICAVESQLRSSASAIDEASIGFLSREIFDQLRKQYPQINAQLLQSISCRCIAALDMYEESHALKLEARAARRLYITAQRSGESLGENTASIQLSQDDLASLLGASRSKTNKVLKTLEAKGLIELAYGKITITDLDQLLMLSD